MGFDLGPADVFLIAILIVVLVAINVVRGGEDNEEEEKEDIDRESLLKRKRGILREILDPWFTDIAARDEDFHPLNIFQGSSAQRLTEELGVSVETMALFVAIYHDCVLHGMGDRDYLSLLLGDDVNADLRKRYLRRVRETTLLLMIMENAETALRKRMCAPADQDVVTEAPRMIDGCAYVPLAAPVAVKNPVYGAEERHIREKLEAIRKTLNPSCSR